MKMIKAYIRPQKETEVLHALMEKGIYGATFKSVLGRGKERGLKSSDVYYEELPKSMLMIAVEEHQVSIVQNIITALCRQGKTGAFGDGKIFVLPLEEVVTIRTEKVEK